MVSSFCPRTTIVQRFSCGLIDSPHLFIQTRFRKLKDDVSKLLVLRQFHRIVRQFRDKLRFEIGHFIWRRLPRRKMFILGRAFRVWAPSLSLFSFSSWYTNCRGPCCVGALITGVPPSSSIMVTFTKATRGHFVSTGPWMAMITRPLFLSWTGPLNGYKFVYILDPCFQCPWGPTTFSFAQTTATSFYPSGVALSLFTFALILLRPGIPFHWATGTTGGVGTRAKGTQTVSNL